MVWALLMIIPKYNFKLSVFLPHTKVYGGVRHFVEVGNILNANGYCYTLYTPDGKEPEWISYHGKIKKLEQAYSDSHDVAITGDTGMLEIVKEINADLKIAYVLGPRYVKNYNKYLDTFQIWIGISKDWLKYFTPPAGVYYYTNPLGVNRFIFNTEYSDKLKNIKSVRILCFGRINKKIKGVSDILKATKGIVKRDKHIRLMMFDSSYIRLPWWVRLNRRLTTRIQRYLVKDQKELADLYRQAHIFISAEKSAGWSNTAAEAMACKTAVICTPNGTKDFAINNETALIVPPGRPDKIKEALERLINDRDLRLRIAENGFNKIQKFTWEAHCIRLLTIIKKIKSLRI